MLPRDNNMFSKPVNKELAGTIILDETLKWMVIVKGHRSGLWGLPKGHREFELNVFDGVPDPEPAIDGALRETYEETGLDIKLLVNVLPCILTKRAKLFLLTLPRSETNFKIIDTNEIDEVLWYPIKNLSSLVDQTRMLKSLHGRMDHIRSKIKQNQVNYYCHIHEKTDSEPESPTKKQFVINSYLCKYIIQNKNKGVDRLVRDIQKEFNNLFYEPELRAAIKEVLIKVDNCTDQELSKKLAKLTTSNNGTEPFEPESPDEEWKFICGGQNKSSFLHAGITIMKKLFVV